MKKSKLFVLGLIALVLAGGLALASCRAGCDGPGNCDIKDGKGNACTNYSFNQSNGTVSGCAAVKAIIGDKSGKCDC